MNLRGELYFLLHRESHVFDNPLLLAATANDERIFRTTPQVDVYGHHLKKCTKMPFGVPIRVKKFAHG